MVNEVYNDLLENQYNLLYYKETVIITPKNKIVFDINNVVLHSFPGIERIYLSSDSICSLSIDSNNLDLLYQMKFLNQLEFSGLPTQCIESRHSNHASSKYEPKYWTEIWHKYGYDAFGR